MRGNSWRLTLGAALMIVALAGFVIADDHTPYYNTGCAAIVPRSGRLIHCSGWTPTAYDAVKIVMWAALIVGAILVAVGLIRTWRAAPGNV
jgi:hypothetical protein